MNMSRFGMVLAVEAWDKTKSPLANKYLGRKILQEVLRHSAIRANLAILAVATDQPTVLKHLIKGELHILNESSVQFHHYTLRVLATYLWCAEKTNMTGYARLLSHTRNMGLQDNSLASEDIESYVTSPTGRLNPNATEFALKRWNRNPVANMRSLMDDMARVAAHRENPRTNDLNWTHEHYNWELDQDLTFLRERLDFPPQLPHYPEDPIPELPQGFRGFTEYPHFPPTDHTIETFPDENTSEPTNTDPLADIDRTSMSNPDLENAITTAWDLTWNTPATTEEITGLEKALNITLPTDYTDFLHRHDGTTDREFCSIAQIFHTAQELHEINEDVINDEQNPTEYRNSINLDPDTGKLRNGPWVHGWIPFFDYGNGQIDCIDCNPGPNGTHGQIIRYNPGGHEGLIYPSYRHWLLGFLDEPGNN
jgi:cell wall assembly regulator SMI1